MSGRPAAGYKLANGTKVPGTTTVAKMIDDPGGLIHWAWQCGVDGKDYRAERDTAASIGTLAHDMVECHITGIPHVPAPGLDENAVEKAEQAFTAYLAWEKRTKLKIVQTEISLVSERYRFGGTLDAIGEIDGELCLLDWKSSNRIYPAYLLQLAAYTELWNENRGDFRPITGGAHLCRFSKDYPDFHHHHFASLGGEWEAFLHCLALYRARQTIKGRAA